MSHTNLINLYINIITNILSFECILTKFHRNEYIFIYEYISSEIRLQIVKIIEELLYNRI